jgi:hypothetical protein
MYVPSSLYPFNIADTSTRAQWKQDASLRETKVMRRYHIQDREDYHKYNKLCGQLRSLVHRLSLLPGQDGVRQRREGEMLDKLYDMGILGECEDESEGRARISVSSSASENRRRRRRRNTSPPKGGREETSTARRRRRLGRPKGVSSRVRRRAGEIRMRRRQELYEAVVGRPSISVSSSESENVASSPPKGRASITLLPSQGRMGRRHESRSS